MSATRFRCSIVLVALTASCSSEPSPDTSSGNAIVLEAPGSAPSNAASAPGAAAGAHQHFKNKTTSAKIAVGNLDSQIESMSKSLARRPADAALRGRMVASLLTRAGHLGTVGDYRKALEVAEQGVKNRPDNPDALVLRGQVRAALHDFAGAQEDVKAATSAGEPKNLARVQMSILLGLGDLEEALEVARTEAQKKADIRTLGLHAMILSRMGKIDEAEKQFREAENSFKNVTPFPLAWLYFHWGSMWELQGDLKRAEGLFREGIRRLPQHAHTAAHLALLVPPSEGIALLEPILERSDDPEYLGLLSRLKDTQKPGSGAADLERAKEGFEAILEKHPLAFADHAVRFWIGPGQDLDRARTIARDNVVARPRHPGAYELLLDAMGNAKPEARDCELLSSATDAKHVLEELEKRLASASAKCAQTP